MYGKSINKFNLRSYLPVLVKEGSWQILPHPVTLQHFCISLQSLSELHLPAHDPVLGSLMTGQKPSLIDRSVKNQSIMPPDCNVHTAMIQINPIFPISTPF